MTYYSQIKAIEEIQRFVPDFLTPFFKMLHHFDSEPYYIAVIALTWALTSKPKAMRITFLFILSAMVNHILKFYINEPRPFMLQSGLNLVPLLDKGYENGFPSGAAQNAILIGGLFMLHNRQFWARMAAVLYIATISFSRLYLGVHFFTDILGGYVVGMTLLSLYMYALPKLEEYFSEKSIFDEGVAFLLSFSVIMWFFPTKPNIAFSLMAIGVFLGAKIHPNRDAYMIRKSLRPLLAISNIVGCLGLALLARKLPIAAFVLPGFWLSYMSIYPFARFARSNSHA